MGLVVGNMPTFSGLGGRAGSPVGAWVKMEITCPNSSSPNNKNLGFQAITWITIIIDSLYLKRDFTHLTLWLPTILCCPEIVSSERFV